MVKQRIYFGLGMLLILLLSFKVAVANDISVKEMSHGACWIRSSKEDFKISSFNDKTSISTTLAGFESEVVRMAAEKLKISNGKLKFEFSSHALHCASMGMSVVSKFKLDDQGFCSWVKVENGQLVFRSLGLLEEMTGDRVYCDGIKPLELLVGLHSKDQLTDLEVEGFSSTIKEITQVVGNLYKVTLHESLFGKEKEVSDKILFEVKPRYIEFNSLQHEIGDIVEIK